MDGWRLSGMRAILLAPAWWRSILLLTGAPPACPYPSPAAGPGRRRRGRGRLQVLVPELEHPRPVVDLVGRQLEQVAFASVPQVRHFLVQPLERDEHLVGERHDRRVVSARLDDERRRDSVEIVDGGVLDVALRILPRRHAHRAAELLQPRMPRAAAVGTHGAVEAGEIAEAGIHHGGLEPVRLDDEGERRVAAVALSRDAETLG